MSIQEAGRLAIPAILSAHPELAVTVAYRSQSATGIRVLTNKQTEPGVMGQDGTTIHTVRVDSSLIDTPDRGAHIKIDGNQAYVQEARLSGGVLLLDLSDTQPVEGI